MNEKPTMTGPIAALHVGESTATRAGSQRSRWRWWLRVAEVRLRFVALVLLALGVVTQWDWLENAWDHVWFAARGNADANVAGDTEYFCPMDPGVLSAWPAICPICNMDLVQRRKHDAEMLPEGVVARMQLSPYRVQLAGIRTSAVERRPLVYQIKIAGQIGRRGEQDQGTQGDAEELVVEAPVSPDDAPLLNEARQVAVRNADGREAVGTAKLVSSGAPPYVRVTLGAGAGDRFAAGTFIRATIDVPAAELLPEVTQADPALAVPETAVVDHGVCQLVFVESMPGQFDAVPVTLGRRCGDHYAVLTGLAEGQRVASAGAFLIDAETRLNPSLAIAYFGANASAGESRAPQVRLAVSGDGGATELSAEDLALATIQAVCPVTDLPLDSMGGPVPVIVEGRKVFLCCKGCEGRLKREPAKYLAKLPSDDRPAN